MAGSVFGTALGSQTLPAITGLMRFGWQETRPVDPISYPIQAGCTSVGWVGGNGSTGQRVSSAAGKGEGKGGKVRGWF